MEGLGGREVPGPPGNTGGLGGTGGRDGGPIRIRHRLCPLARRRSRGAPCLPRAHRRSSPAAALTALAARQRGRPGRRHVRYAPCTVRSAAAAWPMRMRMLHHPCRAAVLMVLPQQKCAPKLSLPPGCLQRPEASPQEAEEAQLAAASRMGGVQLPCCRVPLTGDRRTAAANVMMPCMPPPPPPRGGPGTLPSLHPIGHTLLAEGATTTSWPATMHGEMTDAPPCTGPAGGSCSVLRTGGSPPSSSQQLCQGPAHASFALAFSLLTSTLPASKRAQLPG